ncbi:hypothetical protein ACVWZ6_008449 [Bradyrhizobium sp. GM6.1]
MIEHLSFNEFDMAGITNAVSRYKSAGLRADYDISEKASGVVRIALDNPIAQDGSIAIFEIHKVARSGWLGKKAGWVVQLFSQSPGSNENKHGCVGEKTLAFAISEAEMDLRHGFLSVADIELAATF